MGLEKTTNWVSVKKKVNRSKGKKQKEDLGTSRSRDVFWKEVSTKETEQEDLGM